MKRLSVAFLLMLSIDARAQYYGLPGSPSIVAGPGWGGWWPGYGWGWWNGGVNGSFYSNGLSLYNMPVPTHGVTPGFFGGSDLARNYYNMPPYIGLGWWGYRSPLPNVHGAARDFQQNPLPENYYGPRFATKDVKARYAQAKADPVGESYRQLYDVERANGRLYLRILVPSDNCVVYLQGVPMAGTGRERVFESPVLPQGSKYQYSILTQVPGEASQSREVIGKPGETLTVDFTSPKVP